MRFALFALVSVAAAQTVATRDNNVYFTDARGGRIQLTSMGRDLFPALSPDGKRVAFVRVTSEVPEGDEVQLLCVVEVGLGEPPPVCSSVRYQPGEDPLGGFSKPLWAADGRRVYFLADFSTRTRALCHFDLATGAAMFIAPANQASGEMRAMVEQLNRL